MYLFLDKDQKMARNQTSIVAFKSPVLRDMIPCISENLQSSSAVLPQFLSCSLYNVCFKKLTDIMGNGPQQLQYSEDEGYEQPWEWPQQGNVGISYPLMGDKKYLQGYLLFMLRSEYDNPLIRQSISDIMKRIMQTYQFFLSIYQYTRSILNAVQDCMLCLDEDFYIVQGNEQLFRFLGRSDELVIGQHLGDVFGTYDEHLNVDNPYPESRFICKSGDVSIPCQVINQRAILSASKNKLLIAVFRPDFFPDTNAISIPFEPKAPFDKIICQSPSMEKTIALAKKVAPTASTVLIEGASGTGKELLAEGIHLQSARKGPFIPVNCGAIPKELLQSELFGYEEGAFTGSKKGGQLGKFALADKGTLFLDEIGEMPLDMQSSLLRVLQDRVIIPLGGHKPRHVDLRIISATNKNLREMVSSQTFREDLYYRLNVINIQMPLLKNRTEDIPLLIDYFLWRCSNEMQIAIPIIDEEVMNFFIHYHWPGNVRELQNVIEYMIFVCKNDHITMDMLPDYCKVTQVDYVFVNPLENYEMTAIIKTLINCDNNITAAAKMLRMSRGTLYSKIKLYGIERHNLESYWV